MKKNEAFLYTNYFGLKQKTVKKLADKYGNQLIIDNAQAFFTKPIEGIDTFYSARKFFGVADGGYLYTDRILDETFEEDLSYNRMMHLLKRADVDSAFGFDDFHKNEYLLINQDIHTMSKLTHKILTSVDYESVQKIRKQNYNFLQDKLEHINKIHLEMTEDSVPMAYPLYIENETLRSKLIDNKIFVATYWPNIFDWCKESSIEYKLAKYILPLPVDQRYDIENMKQILIYFNID